MLGNESTMYKSLRERRGHIRICTVNYVRDTSSAFSAGCEVALGQPFAFSLTFAQVVETLSLVVEKESLQARS